MVKRVDKRGELTSTQLAMIILAVVGFLIIGFALYKVFNNDSLTNRDLCRLSIISRATVPGITQQAVPLNCFTEKICITVDKSFFSAAAIFGNKKSDCKQFAGEENVRTVEVSLKGLGNQEKAKETIQREVANSMYDCWLMTGQGKMDIFKGTPQGSVIDKAFKFGIEWVDLKVPEVKPTCIVCSRVAFSDALISHPENKSLKGIDYNKFMSREKVPGSALTYFQAFTDESVGSGYGVIEQSENKLAPYIIKKEPLGNDDFEAVKKILIEQAKTPGEKGKIGELKSGQVQEILNQMKTKPTNQIAIVFAQIKVSGVNEKDQFWNTLQNGAILSGTVGLSGPGKVLSILGFTPLTKFLTYVIGVGGVSTYLAFEAEATTHSNQALASVVCDKFQSTQKDQKGCSLVKLVNWDVNTVNSLCTGGIEGNL